MQKTCDILIRDGVAQIVSLGSISLSKMAFLQSIVKNSNWLLPIFGYGDKFSIAGDYWRNTNPGQYSCIKSWKKCIKSIFKEMSLKLAANDWSSCWHQNFIPRVLSAPAPGLYTCIKSWKFFYKIWLQKTSFFLTCSKWLTWQKVSVDIKILSPGVVCPWPVALYVY